MRTSDVLTSVLCCGFFAVAAYFRQRWVGGCDAWAYYAEAQNLLGRPIPLGPDPDLPNPNAQMPLCMELAGGKPTSFFLPGFPLVLAIAGLVNAEFFVNPALGALTGWMLYLIARPKGAPIALFAAAIWLSNLLSFWGSTQLMSGVPSASVLTLSLLLAQRGCPLMAGGAAGFAFAIRPTNLLFWFVLPWFCRGWRERGRLGVGLAGAILLLVVWHVVRFGFVGPPYLANTAELGLGAAGHQLRFFAVEMARLFWVAIPFAAIAVVRAPRSSAPYVVWIGSFVAFYALWNHPIEEWWGTRFLLPSVPALILLAADGAQISAQAARRLGASRAAPVLAAMLLVAFAVASFKRKDAAGWLRTDTERHYYADALRVKALVEPNALIGATNHTGPLRLYANLATFSWIRHGAYEIVEWAWARKRPVYLTLDEFEAATSPNTGKLGHRFRMETVEILPSGKPLYRVQAHRRAMVLAIGTASARPHLVRGWSGDERAGETPFVWALGTEAVVRVPLAAGAAYRMRFRAWPLGAISDQRVSIEVQGQTVADIAMQPGPGDYEVPLPDAPEDGIVKLRFAAARSPADVNGSPDTRPLAVAFETIAFIPTDDPRARR